MKPTKIDPEGSQGPSRACCEVERWDLTAYCWRVYRHCGTKVRMVVYTAPGRAGALAGALDGRGVRCRARGSGEVRVGAAAAILKLLRHLNAPAMTIAAAAEYEAMCANARPFQEMGPEEVRARRAVVARMCGR